MSSFQFGFLFPWFLALVPIGIAALIYVYRRSGKSIPKTVGTTYLLKLLTKPPEMNRRFIPPIHFWLELTALLALIAGLSLPYWRGEQIKILFFIDDSFSMRALATARESLFQIAQREAIQRIQEQPGNALVKIASASGACSSSDYLARQDASEILNRCVPTYAEDRLETQLSNLIQNNDSQKIFIFSDKKLLATEVDSKIVYYNLRADSHLASLENLAIVGGSIDKNEGKIRVLSFRKNSKKENLFVRFGKISEEKVQYYSTKKLEFIASPEKETVISFETGDTQWEVLQVQIETQVNDRLKDAILEDNIYWFTKKNAKKTLGLVSHKGSTFGLEKVAQYDFKPYSLESYKNIKDDRLSALIFYQVTPDSLPNRPALFILPENKFIFHALSEQEIPITRWLDDSPITKYVNFSLLPKKGYSLEIPEWAHGEIFGNRGITLATGTRLGKKYIASGLPLLPFSGAKNSALSILMLNILLDLTESFEYLVGELMPVSERVKEIAHLDTGSSISMPQAQTPSKIYPLKLPGIIQMLEENGEKALYPVNFISKSESDISQVAPLELKKNEQTVQTQQDTISFARILIAIAFIFLTFDLLLRLFKILFRKGRFA